MTALQFPPTPSDGDTYAGFVFNAAKNVWQWQALIPSVESLADTVITTPSAGEALVYDGTNWVNDTAGKILQVVSVENSVTDTKTGSSFSNTSLAATITPTSTSNKIYIVVTGSGGVTNAGGAGGIDFDIFSSATSGRLLAVPVGIFTTTSQGIGAPIGINYLDSPNTTSAVTYTVQFALAGAATSGAFRDSKVMTLMEVAE